jgi:uncharacterized spore protein YtfJ
MRSTTCARLERGYTDRREVVAVSIEDVIGQARDVMTVKRVFGEPYERDGTTVIPVAAVRGGAGGGGGQDSQGQSGSGSGFGLSARPVGAFVLREGEVSWRPAYDATRVALLGEVVALVTILALRGMVKARAKARRKARSAS